MDRDRGTRRDDRRRREDIRDRGSTYDRDRSRSPPTRDRRDDRRRERSPPRSPRRAATSRSDRDNYISRNRDTPPPPRRPADRGPPPRQPLDTRSANPAPRYGRPYPKHGQSTAPDTRMANGVEDEDSEAEMLRVMGFEGFRSTKNTKVPGNDKNYGVRKEKKSEYRQYMNRTGGFNRALSPSRA